MASIFKRGRVWWIHYYVGRKSVTRSLRTTSERVALDRKKKFTAFEITDQLPEPTAVGVRDLIRMMRINVYSNARTRIFYPLRIFGWRRAATPQRIPRLDKRPDGN